MAQELVNYEAVLADLRARRASIDAAIAAIEQLQNVGGGTGSTDGVQVAKSIDPSSIPEDAFFGLSIVEAVKKYLTIVKRKQSLKEIADALDRGGLPHTSSNFVATVGTMLRRATDPDLAKVGRGDWGLASWYGHRRPKQEPVKRTRKPRVERPSKGKKSASLVAPIPTGGRSTIFDHAAAAISRNGGPMEIDALLSEVSARAQRPVAKATLVGMLAERVRKGETFNRPAPSTYGLIDVGVH